MPMIKNRDIPGRKPESEGEPLFGDGYWDGAIVYVGAIIASLVALGVLSLL